MINIRLNEGKNTVQITNLDRCDNVTANITAPNLDVGQSGILKLELIPRNDIPETITATAVPPIPLIFDFEDIDTFHEMTRLSNTTLGYNVKNNVPESSDLFIPTNSGPYTSGSFYVPYTEECSDEESECKSEEKKCDSIEEIKYHRVEYTGSLILNELVDNHNSYITTAVPAVHIIEKDIKVKYLIPSIESYNYTKRKDYIYIVNKVRCVPSDAIQHPNSMYHIPDDNFGIIHNIPYAVCADDIINGLNNLPQTKFCEYLKPCESESSASPTSPRIVLLYGQDITFTIDPRFANFGLRNTIIVTCDLKLQMNEFNIAEILAIQQSYVRVNCRRTHVQGYKYTNNELVKAQSSASQATNNGMFVNLIPNVELLDVGVDDNGNAVTNIMISNILYMRKNLLTFSNGSNYLYSVTSYDCPIIKAHCHVKFTNYPYIDIDRIAFLAIYISSVLPKVVKRLDVILKWNELCGGDVVSNVTCKKNVYYRFVVQPYLDRCKKLVLSRMVNITDELILLDKHDLHVKHQKISTHALNKYYYLVDNAYVLKINRNIVIYTDKLSDLDDNKYTVASVAFKLKCLANYIKFGLCNLLDVPVVLDADYMYSTVNTYTILSTDDAQCDPNTSVSCLHQSYNPDIWDSRVDNSELLELSECCDNIRNGSDSSESH